jgi:hypothetical protein
LPLIRPLLDVVSGDVMDEAIRKIMQPSGSLSRTKITMPENLERMLQEAGPGQFLRLNSGDGRPFALIDYEDLTHILSLAGCDSLDASLPDEAGSTS